MTSVTTISGILGAFTRKGRRVLYIAEIGLNHNGRLADALVMVDRAAEAGADMVKFQTFRGENLNSLYTTSLMKGEECSFPDRSQIDFLNSLTLADDEYPALVKRCQEREVVFFSAPFDLPSVALLEKLGVPVYKVASSEVTHIMLLRAIGKTGKPVIMSTGMANEDEILRAVHELRASGCPEIALLHCVSLYPYRGSEANLARIGSLASLAEVTVGLSDHSRGNLNAVAGAVLGARIIEKHFTIDSEYPCPDKEVSLTPEEFRSMTESVEEALELLGDGAIRPGGRELETAKGARRSLFFARDLPAGATIDYDDIVALRPGLGIGADRIDTLIGTKTSRAVSRGMPVVMDMLISGDR